MLIFKIIACIVLWFIGFYAFLLRYSLEELIEKASKEEKKVLYRIDAIATFVPLIASVFIIAL